MKKSVLTILLVITTFFAFYFGTASEAWLNRYSYVNDIVMLSKNFPSFFPTSEYFLVVLVDAKHPDYSSPSNYCSSLVPGMLRCKAPDPGHAWIVIVGTKDGKPWIFEGGHTVNCSAVTKHYIKHLLGWSDTKQTENPATALFVPTTVGSLEVGPGENRPSFAAAIPLTQEGFDRISRLFDENGYDFSHWGIQGPNCVQFALSCLSAAGIELSCYDTLSVPQSLSLFGKTLSLWTNPSYSKLTLKTPDLLEKRLLDLVKCGKAFYALPWYKAFRELCNEGLISTCSPEISSVSEDVILLADQEEGISD